MGFLANWIAHIIILQMSPFCSLCNWIQVLENFASHPVESKNTVTLQMTNILKVHFPTHPSNWNACCKNNGKKKQPISNMPVHTVRKQCRATAPVFVTTEWFQCSTFHTSALFRGPFLVPGLNPSDLLQWRVSNEELTTLRILLFHQRSWKGIVAEGYGVVANVASVASFYGHCSLMKVLPACLTWDWMKQQGNDTEEVKIDCLGEEEMH